MKDIGKTRLADTATFALKFKQTAPLREEERPCECQIAVSLAHAIASKRLSSLVLQSCVEHGAGSVPRCP